MQGLLAYDKVIQWRHLASGIINNIRLQMNPFASRIVHEGDFDVAHLCGFKGAIGSTPWLWDSPPYNRYALSRSFLYKKEVSTRSSIEYNRTLMVLFVRGLLVSCFFGLALCKLDLLFLLRYITGATAVTLPVFTFSIAFSLLLMISSAKLVTLTGWGSVDIKLRAKCLSNLRHLSTCNPLSLYPDSYSLSESLLEDSY